jgi:hypothetical protein
MIHGCAYWAPRALCGTVGGSAAAVGFSYVVTVITERQDTAMTIAVEIVSTATLKQYEGQLADLGLTPFGTGVPGVMFHWAAVQEDGQLHVVEVWESREKFEIFLGTTLGPAIARTGVTDIPQLTFYEIENYLTPLGYPASVSALHPAWNNPPYVEEDEED